MTLPKFESKAPSTTDLQGQRRTQGRSTFLGGGQLSIEYAGQLIVAQVINSNDRGLGVEMASPIDLESVVSFRGVGLRGKAAVIYCAIGEDGVYRVGLDIQEVRFGDLDFSSLDLLDETAQLPARCAPSTLESAPHSEPKLLTEELL